MLVLAGLASGGMPPAIKQQLFRKLVASDAPECPICMDMAQDGVVSECGHGPFCRECMNTLLHNSVRGRPRLSCCFAFCMPCLTDLHTVLSSAQWPGAASWVAWRQYKEVSIIDFEGDIAYCKRLQLQLHGIFFTLYSGVQLCTLCAFRMLQCPLGQALYMPGQFPILHLVWDMKSSLVCSGPAERKWRMPTLPEEPHPGPAAWQGVLREPHL